MRNEPLTVVLLDLGGLDIRLAAHRKSAPLPDWVYRESRFQEELARLEEQSAGWSAQARETWVPVDMSLSTTHGVIECVSRPYAESQALAAMYDSLRDTPCAGLLDLRTLPTGPLRTETVVVTSDNHVLLRKPPHTAATSSMAWSVGFGALARPSDEGALRNVAVLGLQGQLGLSASALEPMVRLVAFARENEGVRWAGYAIADFRRCGPDYSAQQLLDRARKLATAGAPEQLLAQPREQLHSYLRDKEVSGSATFLLKLLDRL